MADLDILLTEALIRFGSHQIFGKVKPAGLGSNINFGRRFLTAEGPVTGVPRIIASPEPLEKQFDDYLQRAPIYRQFQDHLAEHRKIAVAGGWPRVPGMPPNTTNRPLLGSKPIAWPERASGQGWVAGYLNQRSPFQCRMSR